jgi:hypothetical protein
MMEDLEAVVEEASKAFWNACRADLGDAVERCQEPWRDPVKEFEHVRDAVRKGIKAARPIIEQAAYLRGIEDAAQEAEKHDGTCDGPACYEGTSIVRDISAAILKLGAKP